MVLSNFNMGVNGKIERGAIFGKRQGRNLGLMVLCTTHVGCFSCPIL